MYQGSLSYGSEIQVRCLVKSSGRFGPSPSNVISGQLAVGFHKTYVTLMYLKFGDIFP